MRKPASATSCCSASAEWMFRAIGVCQISGTRAAQRALAPIRPQVAPGARLRRHGMSRRPTSREWKLRRLEDDKVAKSTVDKNLSVAKSFFNWCINQGITNSKPIKKVKLFHEDNERVRFLDPDTEYPKLLAEVRKGPWYLEPIVMLDLNTGLRRRNLLDLDAGGEREEYRFDRGVRKPSGFLRLNSGSSRSQFPACSPPAPGGRAVVASSFARFRPTRKELRNTC